MRESLLSAVCAGDRRLKDTRIFSLKVILFPSENLRRRAVSEWQSA
jgi:hypothetical protein